MRNSMRGASYPPLRAGDQMSDGQIMLSHGSPILWFSPEEFEEFCRLGATARQQLADAASLPPLSLTWGYRTKARRLTINLPLPALRNGLVPIAPLRPDTSR